ncbi:hypothetical protein LXA47_31210 [Massilia sp. P8910]|uniref:helix-turn-helix transcriptional regulator n=1 Tax=Massilia antarctica TaxID=2765360 RepID=UPI001E36FBC1|nr:hypothetical protein [Massilia antarctica]MCE3608040.1 hypothetical protein [Massilia antarctica]
MFDESKFAEVEARARLHAMPPSTPLTTEFAAAFLGYSVATMETMRKTPDGPVYSQPPGDGPNKKVMYQISELLAWMDRNKIGSTTQAMIRAGKAFSTLAGIASEEPYFIDQFGLLWGPVAEATIGTVRDRLETHDVVFLTAIDAATRQWDDPVAHKEHAESVQAALLHASQSIDANVEASELRASMKG